MSYRDDHEAAIMRADAADREAAKLGEQNQQLVAELELAKQWLGGPRTRAIALAIVLGVAAAFGVGGLVLGRTTASCPSCPVVAAAPTLPGVTGVIVADGPKVGHWTLTATRCVFRSDGIELAAAGSEDHIIWLTERVVEIEVPGGDFFLEEKQCKRTFAFSLGKKESGYEGYVSLDCSWDENRIQGRIDFKRCR